MNLVLMEAEHLTQTKCRGADQCRGAFFPLEQQPAPSITGHLHMQCISFRIISGASQVVIPRRVLEMKTHLCMHGRSPSKANSTVTHHEARSTVTPVVSPRCGDATHQPLISFNQRSITLSLISLMPRVGLIWAYYYYSAVFYWTG